MATSAQPKRARRRRWPWILGGIAGAIVLPLVLVFVLLASAADRAVVVREALDLVNSEFAGRIELRKAWLFPNGRFFARDVTIRGPDGAVIIKAATVETRVDLLALAKKRLHLTHTVVGGGALFLAIDDRGLVNIVETFTPKRAGAPQSPKPAANGPANGFVLDIDGADAAVDVARIVLGASTLTEVRNVTLHGSVLLDPAGVLTIDVPSLGADAVVPLTGSLQLAATTVRLAQVDLQIATDATLDDAHLKARASLNVTTLAGLATLTDSSAGPRFLARWLPELEPRGVRGDADLALDGGTLKLTSLRASPLQGGRQGGEGAGVITGSARVDFSKGDAEAHLIAKGLDARALFGKLPTSTLGLKLEASGKNLFHDARQLEAHLAIDTSVVEGQPVGPGVTDARLTGETLALTHLNLAFPGGRVQGAVTVSGQGLSAKAQIDAPDLGSLRAALEGICGVNLPHFAGHLVSQVEIEGPWAAPALRAEVQAPHLSLNGIEASDVAAHLDAPRLGRQMDLQGQVKIGDLDLAGHALRDVGLSVAWTTPDLHLEFQAEERGKAIDLVADLLLPKDLESATVSALELHAAGSDWLLSQPATVDFRRGVSFEHVELRADPQRLSVSLAIAPNRLSGTVAVEALDLSQLPATLLPALALSGQVVGVVSFDQKASMRTGNADLTLAHVAFKGFEVPSGRIQAALDGKRVTVSLSAKLGHGEVTLTGAGPMPRLPGKLEADLAATGIVLDDFASLAPRLAGTHGALSLGLHLGGEWAAPIFALTASVDGLTGAWTHDPEAGVLAVPLAATLEATLSSEGLTQELKATAGPTLLLTLAGTAPITSGKFVELLETPSKLAAELRALPLDERLTLGELPLGPVLRRLPWARAPKLGGTVSATGSFHGTFRAPRGELTLNGRQLLYEQHALGGLALRLSAQNGGFEGEVELHPPKGQLKGKLEWRLAPEQVGDKEARLAARLTADLALSGLPLSIALGEQAPLQGLAELTGSFRGSLAQPSAHATLSLHELQLQNVPAGSLDAKASWNGTHLVTSVTGQQPQGGRLEGRGDVPLRLQGELFSQPLTATLEASAFDLAPLGGLAALGGGLRAIGGRLDSHLKLAGTLGAPQPTGTLSLSGGKLALAGFGQFNEVAAQISLDASGADIQKIAGKSGGGTFLVQGKVRRGETGFALQAHIGTDRLGVYAADRLIGFLSSSEDLSGTLARAGTDLTLAVHSALFRLPDLVPKTTGATTLDPDIVVGRRPPVAVSNSKAYAIRVKVVAPDGLEVKATDLEIKARATLALVIQGDVEMQGGVIATGGVVNAYGRRFEVDHANVTFGQGDDFGPANNPTIDARAAEAIGHYRLFIDVTGPLANLQIVSSSEPPLDKEKVGELLVTGSSEGIEGRGTATTSQGGGLGAASALGGVVTERLRNWLGAYMPLDVLTVDPSHLEAGKHLTPRLYVGAIENLGVTDPRVNGAEIHANYKLTDQWALDSRYGTAQAGDLDLQWTRSW